MNDMFRKFSALISGGAGAPWPFIVAAVIVVAWTIGGLAFGFSEHWILAVTTPTTVFTFLMVFLIQNSQNRHDFSTQLKLDELIRAIGAARNHLIDLEHLSDDELTQLKQGFERLRDRASRDAHVLSAPVE